MKVIGVILLAGTAHGIQRNPSWKELLASNRTQAERVVMNSVENGQPADFAGQTDKRIKSSFVQDLIVATSKTTFGDVTIQGATIEGPLDFRSLPESARTLPFRLALDGCTFTGEVTLSGAHFEKGLELDYSTFQQGLDLSSVQVDGKFSVSAVQLGDDNQSFPITLANSTISGDLSLSVFQASRIDATGVSAKNVWITLAPKGIDELLLAETSISGFLDIESSPHADSIVRKKIDLTSANVGNLVIRLIGTKSGDGTVELHWPDKVYARGLSFRAVKVEQYSANANGSTSDDALNLQFLNKANFSESAFNGYEQLLRGNGRVADADAVFTAMHKKLRSDLWQSSAGKGFGARLRAAAYSTLDFGQHLFLGYGRSAIAPLAWSAALVILGMLIFRRREVLEQQGKEDFVHFSAFWYSLELFLPVVDLGLAKNWRPRSGHPVLLTYWRAHQLAGWILIPVAVAGFTGAFK